MVEHVGSFAGDAVIGFAAKGLDELAGLFLRLVGAGIDAFCQQFGGPGRSGIAGFGALVDGQAQMGEGGGEALGRS